MHPIIQRLKDRKLMRGTLRSMLLVGAALCIGAPRAAAAQELGPGAMPIGVRLVLEHDDYLIVGSTAREVLDQLRSEGPGGWTRYSYVYSWRYANERLPLTNGMPSNRCRPVDFEITIRAAAAYPRWNRPPDADSDLVAAWEAFSELLEQQWDQYRDGIVRRSRESATRVRRFEDQCAFINERVREMVVDTFNEPDGSGEERVRLAWPPAGFEALTSPEAAHDPLSDASAGADAEAAGAESGEPDDLGPVVNPAVDIDTAVGLDFVRDQATGLVLHLSHLGEVQFQEAFGTYTPDGAQALELEASFAFPSFTEVLIAAAAAALSVRGQIDLDAPISEYRNGLPTGLGATTLEQLLSHRAGLDNAQVPDTANWVGVMDDLDDRALFTEPGAVYSQSRYSYPLAVRALEAATGDLFEETVASTVLEPLGMSRTRIGPRDEVGARDGLPITYSTAEDMTAFWTAWIAGEVPGSGPDLAPVGAISAGLSGADGRTFFRGYWQDRIGQAPRISLMCGASPTGYAAGIQVLPETQTIMVFWSRYDLGGEDGARAPPGSGRWPRESVRFVLSRIAAALQLDNEVYRPTTLTGGGQPGRSTQRCAEPSVSERRVQDFGPRAPAASWMGRYINGEWFFELNDRDGSLVSPVDPTRAPFAVRHYGGDLYFTDMEIPGGPMVGFALQLFIDDAGRRYLRLGIRTYVHEEDRPGR